MSGHNLPTEGRMSRSVLRAPARRVQVSRANIHTFYGSRPCPAPCHPERAPMFGATRDLLFAVRVRARPAYRRQASVVPKRLTNKDCGFSRWAI